MDVEPPAHSKDAQNLICSLLRLVGVMQYAMRVDVIKAAIFKGQIPHISFNNRRQIADPLPG